jgi:succinoglycan biosynthesis transport protein ExoP
MYPSRTAEDLSIDMASITRALARALWWILPVTAVAAVLSILVLSAIPPRYKGEARILIEAQEGLALNERTPVVDRAIIDQEGVASQVQVISSRDLGRRVIASLRLADLQEFGGRGGFLADVVATIGFGRDRLVNAAEERTLEAYVERLSVFQVERSRVIQIEFTSEDPDLAAKVANEVVATYLELQAGAKAKSTNDATRWLEGEIQRLRPKVAEAEAKVESYRSGNELFVASNNNTLIQQQLTDLNAQLTAARGLKSEAEAKAGQLRRVLDNGGSIDAASEILNATNFQRLRERQGTLRSRAAELSAVYLPAHPQIQGVAAQIADIDRQIRQEARKILGALENDVRVADQRMVELRSQLDGFKVQAARANEEDIQLRALEREARSERDLLETLLARYREASARQNADAQPADARVVSTATAPIKPYFPKLAPLTAVITLAVFILCATFVIMAELITGNSMRTLAVVDAFDEPAEAGRAALDDGPSMRRVSASETAARAPSQVARPSSSLPIKSEPSGETRRQQMLAALVAAGRKSHGLDRTKSVQTNTSDQALPSAQSPGASDNPVEPQMKALDAMALWTRFAASGDNGHVVAVTAAESGNVSRNGALALARAAAQSHDSICLILLTDDAGNLEDLIGKTLVAGLRDVSERRNELKDVIFKDRRSRASIVTYGKTTESVDPEAHRKTFEAIAGTYRSVIVDAGRLTSCDGWVLELVAAANGVAVASSTTAVGDMTARIYVSLSDVVRGDLALLHVPRSSSAAQSAA